MKKLLAIVVAVVMVCALSVSVFADGTATVSSTFTAYATGTQYDTPKPVEVGEGLEFRTTEPGTGHIDITGLIEQVADLENVTALTVTYEIVGEDAFTGFDGTGGVIIGLRGILSDGTNPEIAPINWSNTTNPYVMTATEMPADLTGVYIDTSSYAAIDESAPCTFNVTVEVSYVGEAKTPVETEPADDTATDDTATDDTAATTEPETPAETGIVLAVLPMAVAAAAAVIAKRR